MRNFIIFLMSGWVGFYTMALEILAGRMLFNYFGGSIYVWGSIIGIFLVMLSLGYLTGGNLSRMDPTLRMLCVFLIASAMAVLPIYFLSDQVLYWASTHPKFDSRWGTLAATFILFGAPSYIIGMFSPYAVRLLVSDAKDSGRRAGWLYFVSTVGGGIGTIMTSFYLVLWFQVMHMLIGMIVISVVLSLIAYFIASGDDGY